MKAIRKKKGMVQKDLADATGLGQAAIANYEKGIRFPGEETLRRITEVLEVSLDYLMAVQRTEELRLQAGEMISDKSLKDRLLDILLNDTAESAYQEILQHSRTIPLARWYNDFLIPLMRNTGDLWEAGRLTVAEEHLISGKTRELVVMLGDRATTYKSSTGDSSRTWLGFVAPGEEHDLPILMLSRLMLERGWNPVFLGHCPPLPSLLDAVAKYRPDTIAVSITMPSYWNGLETYLRRVQEGLARTCRIIVGGAGIKPHRDAVSSLGIVIADDLPHAVELAERT